MFILFTFFQRDLIQVHHLFDHFYAKLSLVSAILLGKKNAFDNYYAVFFGRKSLVLMLVPGESVQKWK